MKRYIRSYTNTDKYFEVTNDHLGISGDVKSWPYLDGAPASVISGFIGKLVTDGMITADDAGHQAVEDIYARIGYSIAKLKILYAAINAGINVFDFLDETDGMSTKAMRDVLRDYKASQDDETWDEIMSKFGDYYNEATSEFKFPLGDPNSSHRAYQLTQHLDRLYTKPIYRRRGYTVKVAR